MNREQELEKEINKCKTKNDKHCKNCIFVETECPINEFKAELRGIRETKDKIKTEFIPWLFDWFGLLHNDRDEVLKKLEEI